jgi:hypothetical protein
MVLPLKPVDVAFEAFWQALSPDGHALAFEFKAFACSRALQTPAPLLPRVMSDCGVEAVWRAGAGHFTRRPERLTETALRQSLSPRIVIPWLGCRRRSRVAVATTVKTSPHSPSLRWRVTQRLPRS